MKNFFSLERLLGITFKNFSLIQQAFFHRSYLNETKEKNLLSNERLEFLGDSILSFLISEYLFLHYPMLEEGKLTNLRSSIVKTETLAKLAQKLNLGNYLFLSRGEDESGGRNNPSLLADTLEAFLGAVYLDQGLEKTKKIVEKILISPYLPSIIKYELYKDSKSTFQEKVQEKKKISPLYKVLKEEGPDHAKEFTVGVFVGRKLWGVGKGKSKQEAEKKAAFSALEKWEKK